MSFLGAGRKVESAVFGRGVSGFRPKVPTSPQRLEAKAAKTMSAQARAYIMGGAGTESTVAANRAAFDRVEILPAMLRDTTGADMSTEVFGTALDSPLLVAPIGAAGLVRNRPDIAVGEAAASLGVPYIFSSQGSDPMERVAGAMGDAPRWFQLYWSKDLELVRSFVARAEAIGAGAIVLTADTTQLGWRPRDLDLGYLPFTRGIGIAQYTSDRRFSELVAERMAASSDDTDADHSPVPTPTAIATLLRIARNHPGRFVENLRSPVPRAAVQTFLDVYSNPALSWDHVEQLRGMTTLPVVVKGILTPGDAKQAFAAGADAVMVSNHGGRQVDGAIGSLDALREIRREIAREHTLILDSGIRSGADVFKAIACGADAVTIGRPHVYGLAIDGARGVESVLRNIIAELDLTMSLSGASSLAEIDSTMVRVRE